MFLKKLLERQLLLLKRSINSYGDKMLKLDTIFEKEFTIEFKVFINKFNE